MHGLRAPGPEFADESTPVAVVGLGKIGLPLAIHFVRRGRKVWGVDSNVNVVRGINARRCHVEGEPELESEVVHAVARGRLEATTDTAAAVGMAGVVVVVVPVIVDDEHEIDFRSLDAATLAIARGLAPGKLVVYETTLPVGTTAGRLRGQLEEVARLKAGRDFYLAFSPERVSSGRIFQDLASYSKVVGGVDEASAIAARAFYASVLDVEVITMASAGDAEFVKLIETTYRDVNVALANEYARYADRHGLDVAAAIQAANSQPFSHIHSPGLGVGGHCIPVYPYFLLKDSEADLGLPSRARVVNDGMAAYAADRLEDVIGPLAGRSVLILGAAYRGGVREHAFSSARLLQAALAARGAEVLVHDPLFSDEELRGFGYSPFQSADAGRVSAVVVQADHSDYRELDFAQFTRCTAVLDGRRALSRQAVEGLGMRYLFIGDGRRESRNGAVPVEA
ncbi:nucleotide sugar dehydrogenase [Candidatus Nephthysia bennettiae]|uniref:nucleotide sugar dehydrogenase n=1 Tax=Candidatus Nephthysia bennettiae TaxID=3127016 RepID=UPI0030C6E20E